MLRESYQLLNAKKNNSGAPFPELSSFGGEKYERRRLAIPVLL
jgi:hypothetical protein